MRSRLPTNLRREWPGKSMQQIVSLCEKFTALAVSHAIQARTGVSIAKVVKQLRPLRSATITINGATQTYPPAIPTAQRKILTDLGFKPGY